MIELLPEETAELIFSTLSETIATKNNRIGLTGRPKLHVTRQTDIPGVHKIDVDYPTEDQAIKNHYIARIAVHLDGSGIELTMERAATATHFHLADSKRVFFEVVKAIISY